MHGPSINRVRAEPSPNRADGHAFLGHPPGLTFLFLTGMWEVAALFGMRTILVFYLVTQRHYLASAALAIYGWSSALSFSTSLVCAPIADRFLGLRRAVILGAAALALAHFMLIAPALLVPSLVVIAFAAGFFRPALVGQVWLLYGPTDPRRHRALVLYKLGCNLGGIIGPLICGTLYETSGWTMAVGFCGTGMIISLGTYLGARRFLPPDDQRSVAKSRLPGPDASPATEARAISLARRTMLLFAAGLGGTLHWTAANQQGGTMALWAYRSLNRTVHVGSGVFLIPAAWFQSLNPILILLLTPLLTWYWSRRRAGALAETRNMALGSLLLSAAFGLLVAVLLTANHEQVSWLWLLAAMVPVTLGELHLDPMGQAFFGRLAPRGMLSTSLSLWFLTQAAGYLLGGELGALWERLPPATFFSICAAIAIASALVIALTGRFATSHEHPNSSVKS